MSEDQNILFAKAISGTLEGGELPRWEALCAADPELLHEFEAACEVAAGLRKQVEAMDAGGETPVTIPSDIYERLEADRIAHRKESRSDEDAPDKIVSIFPRFQNLSGLLAVAASLGILALGWWVWKGPGGTPVVATVKTLIVSENLPLATPGEVTRLTDPPINWISLDSRPVKVSIFSGDGKSLLFSGEGDSSPIHWQDLKAADNAETDPVLAPGGTYLFRIEQGGIATEKTVSLTDDAKALADWSGENPETLQATFSRWIEAGYGADVLALAAHAARTTKVSGIHLNEIRKEALKESLSAEKTRMQREKSGNSSPLQ